MRVDAASGLCARAARARAPHARRRALYRRGSHFEVGHVPVDDESARHRAVPAVEVAVGLVVLLFALDYVQPAYEFMSQVFGG